MLYIIVDNSRQYINKALVKKYGLKPGMRTPFTDYKIFKDGKNEEKITSRDQEIYQVPEDDNSETDQGEV